MPPNAARKAKLRHFEEEDALLRAMRRGVTYGYDLSRVTRLRPGRLYPALRRLEADGVIVGKFEDGPGPRRRYYTVVSTVLARAEATLAKSETLVAEVKDWLGTAALDVDCPTCGKIRGQACVTWWRFKPRQPHKARQEALRNA